MKFLSLNNPIIFKRIFGQNPEMLKCLLDTVLQFENDDKIAKLQILDIMNGRQTQLDIGSEIYEIRAEDSKGRLFCIEMDTQPERLFLKRPFYSKKAENTGKKRSFHCIF